MQKRETVKAGLNEGASLRFERTYREPRRTNRKRLTSHPGTSNIKNTKNLKIIVQASIKGYRKKKKNKEFH